MPMPKKDTQNLTLRISPEDRESLEEMALLLGCKYGEKVSLSLLIHKLCLMYRFYKYTAENPDLSG